MISQDITNFMFAFSIALLAIISILGNSRINRLWKAIANIHGIDIDEF